MIRTMVGRMAAMVMITVVGCAAAPPKPVPRLSEVAVVPVAERASVLRAMGGELDRSMKNLKFKDYKQPYFLAYRLKDNYQESLQGRFGSLISDDVTRQRVIYTEVRVGDYKFDNFANVDNEAFRLSDRSADKRAPLGSGEMAIRGALWLLTDEAYKKALSDYLTKKGGAVYATEEKTATPSFSKEKPRTYAGPVLTPKFDKKRWRARIREVTAMMKARPGVLDGEMNVEVNKETRYVVTSEGTSIVDEIMIYSIQMEVMGRAADGMRLMNSRTFYARDPDKLPTDDALKASVKKMLDELEALKKAPVIDPYTGPAILMPEASGVLFHEAVGHRLEGERQRDEEEGRTFKGRIGKDVIPKFLSVIDDPTVRVHGPHQLNGFYAFDDEGVGGQRAVLIEKGVLRAFLKSRTPVEGSPSSNGHGRAQGVLKPMARMANLIVEATADKTMPYDALKKELMAETLRQGKPFGLIIRDITGGSTNTSGYGYQAFKGEPLLIYKVDPKTGVETLVRGAEIVGTPLISINKIVAASKETGVFNGYCGAESGYVPVSTIAPALLTKEIELQRSQITKERPPLLQAPWAK